MTRRATSVRGVPANRPVLAFAIGAALVVVVNAGFLILDPDVTRAVPLLLLIVPVSIASVLGGWRAAVPLAVLTGLAYSFQYVAPVGTIRIGVTEDSASILTYTGVALFVSENGRRRDARRRERERQRAILLRTVSHDLRSPLSAIQIATAELRRADELDADRRERLLDIVGDEAARLDRIIRNLLSLSRVEAGALRPDLAPVSIADIIESSVGRLPERTGDGAPRVEVQLCDDLPEVMADQVQLGQVVTNLIENGLRHGVGSDAVRVEAFRQDDHVAVRVIDDGPGFTEASRARAFDFFEPSGATGAEGIGLAVCKAIVEAHGGSIGVDDTVERGACVTFTVPSVR